MSIGTKPCHDDPWEYTAFNEGREAYLMNRPLDHFRHQDDHRQRAYEDGWLQESIDHLDATPPPKIYRRGDEWGIS